MKTKCDGSHEPCEVAGGRSADFLICCVADFPVGFGRNKRQQTAGSGPRQEPAASPASTGRRRSGVRARRVARSQLSLRTCLKTLPNCRVRARGLQVPAESTVSCRPGPLTGRVFKHALAEGSER
jgi:hypothetical protein